MTKKQQEEKAVFDFFQKLCPDFAGRPITSVFGNDPPDFLCTDAENKRIGVELGEWLNEEQMKSSIDQERAERTFLSAIESEKVPPSKLWIRVDRKKRICASQTERCTAI